MASFLAGTSALVAGFVLMHFSHIRQKQTVTGSLLPTSPPRPDATWLRAPVWRDSVRDGATGAARVGIPIFWRSF